MAADTISFLRSWVSDPLQVGAIVSSGSTLTALITKEISAQCGPVIELGPGTGVFTKAILSRSVPANELVLIEQGEVFANLLALRFPAVRLERMDAFRLSSANLLKGSPVGAVVSGLPLLSMSRKKVMGILTGAFGYMRPDGHFYQFTYGMKCPVSQQMLERLGLKATYIGCTLRNLPPASVYRISRRQRKWRFLGRSRPVSSSNSNMQQQEL